MTFARRVSATVRAVGALLGACAVLGVVTWAQPARPMPELNFRVSFDQSGEVEGRSRATIRAIVEAVPRATDVFVFSHGWNNDPVTAERAYTEFVVGMMTERPADRLSADFKPLLVGIYWPSALFPVSDCLGTVGERSQFDRWAKTTFPRVIQRPDFDSEIRTLYQAVLNESRGVPVNQAAMLRATEIINEWALTDGGDADAEIEGEASILARSAADALRFYQDAVDRNPDVAQAGGIKANSACGALNVLTFWLMKRRAGNVGSRGGYELLRAIRGAAGPTTRIHLIGHSFGTKLLSSALVGVAGQPNPNRVASLTLVQGAFSHFGFSSLDELRTLGIATTREGLYAGVVRSQLVSGYMAVTYSSRDIPNAVFYPLGAAVSHDYLALRIDPQVGTTVIAILPPRPERPGTAIARPPQPALPLRTTEVPKYGALGANGALGPPGRYFRLPKDFSGNELRPSGQGLLNVDANEVIKGHSDYFKPQVYRLLWDVVIASR